MVKAIAGAIGSLCGLGRLGRELGWVVERV